MLGINAALTYRYFQKVRKVRRKSKEKRKGGTVAARNARIETRKNEVK